MVTTGQRTRIGQALIIMLCLSMLGLIGRLVYINTKMAPQLREWSYRRQTQTIPIPGARGVILDRRYRVLAGSTDAFAIYADPRTISVEKDGEQQLATAERHARAATLLAPVLGMSEKEIREKLAHPSSPAYVVLCRTKENKKAELAKLKMRGIGSQPEPIRTYPMGNLAAHVLGHVGKDGKGMEGVELSLNSKLEATAGKRTVFCDVDRRAMFQKPNSYVPPKNGVHVVLTVDSIIQEKLEEQLRERATFHNAESAVGVVMNPKTGEILALANYPTFDPGDAGDVPADVRRNRVLTDPVEPGSVFKPYTMAAALTEGVAKRTDIINCGVSMRVGSRILHDSHPHGALTVEQVLAMSSNIGMSILGQQLGNDRIYNFLHAFGFGEKTGIDLAGEDRGLMPPLKRWNKGSTLSVPMGQEIAITPIQLVTAFSSIINGGKLLKPRVVAAIVSDEGEILEDYTEAKERRQVLDPARAREMTEMLTSVVTSGTGRMCKLSHWQALGKTGTAQIPRIGEARRGYVPGAYLGSFIGAAPASDPSVVVLIMVRHPRKNGYYGSVVALPGVKEVLEFTLNYLNVPHENIADAGRNQIASSGGD
jgi:cell division protein FtsI/penicillin-binding protein 2